MARCDGDCRPAGSTGARAAALGAEAGGADRQRRRHWLLWDSAARDCLADHAVAARPSAAADHRLRLFSAIPESTATDGADHQQQRASVCQPIGAVVSSFALKDSGKTISDTVQYYAVLPDGLQQISPVLAVILRNNSYGLQQPPRLGADRSPSCRCRGCWTPGASPSEPVSRRRYP